MTQQGNPNLTMNTDTAVILAAGMGIRLRNVIGKKPKGLLILNGTSLLQRSCQLLSEQGINLIYMVTGFQHTVLEETLHQSVMQPEIRFVRNPNYWESGSMESLSCVEGLLPNDFLLLESDLLYESRALSILLNDGQPDTVLTSGFTGSQDEVWIQGELSSHRKAGQERGRIIHINKKPDPHLEIQGELVGISWISLELFEAMCRHHRKNRPQTYDHHYEENLSELCSEWNLTYLKITDLVWTEIDTEAHYLHATNRIYPSILKQESNR